MTVFRMLLSIALFIVALFAFIGFFLNGFSWLYFAIAIVGFLLAAWCWPSDTASRRRSKQGLEIVELIDLIGSLIELVASLILLPLRLIGWLLRHAGIDF